MFKIISAELKKSVSKIGIFILSIFLAIILILGVFIYNPSPSTSTKFTLEGTDITSKYSDFYKTNGRKIKADRDIEIAIELIENYSVTQSGNSINYEQYIDNAYEKFTTNFNTYRNSSSNSATEAQITSYRNNLISSLDSLAIAINNGVNKAQAGSYVLLSTKTNYNDFLDYIDDSKNLLKLSVEKAQIANICKDFTDNYKNRIEKCLDNFIYPSLSEKISNTYTKISTDSKYTLLNQRLTNIEAEIQELFKQASIDKLINLNSKEEIDILANKYVDTTKTYVNLIKYELISNALSVVEEKDQHDLIFLSNESKFNINSLKIQYSYLFDNNKELTEFAKPLAIGQTSNTETSAYDYSYFVLKLFSFIIIVYAIMTACHSIAGEIKEGSMRYLAIRPISRTKLLFGKLFSILIMSTIMIIFSTIISLLVGGAVYGFNSLNILTIFNGSTAITLHPILMILLYVASLILELFVYASIAMFMSCLIKSDLLSVTLMLVLYLANILLPIFFAGSNSWLMFYPFSHISLFALFGSSVFEVPNSFLVQLLGTKVFATTNIGLTIFAILAIIILFTFLANLIFKEKEL